ncbi:hypothetical protein EB796_008550 [Bugula neritina]|uniref:Uncharacterized protein n=1 Tax=Bugula neritina TaxID=10212 RepID=A0A7J7K3B6_BUGNE|nr:hypothetical protein EB796_008550 [Bugula neritina]
MATLNLVNTETHDLTREDNIHLIWSYFPNPNIIFLHKKMTEDDSYQSRRNMDYKSKPITPITQAPVRQVIA